MFSSVFIEDIVVIHPDKGIKEGVECYHFSWDLKRTESLVEELKGCKYFADIFEYVFSLDEFDILKRCQYFCGFEYKRDFAVVVRFYPKPLVVDKMKLVLSPPFVEL